MDQNLNVADKILSIGISLEESMGIKNWALTSEQAFDALKKLKENNIGILGIDVLFIQDNVIDFIYDFWGYEKDCTASPDFLNESVQQAYEYINTELQIHRTQKLLFKILPYIIHEKYETAWKNTVPQEMHDESWWKKKGLS
jgi:hypothetical protein